MAINHLLLLLLLLLSCRVNQELVEEAFLPTLKTLFDAPVESPLASVNINEVTDLFVALCNSNNLETAAQKSSINSGLVSEISYWHLVLLFCFSCRENTSPDIFSLMPAIGGLHDGVSLLQRPQSFLVLVLGELAPIPKIEEINHCKDNCFRMEQ